MNDFYSMIMMSMGMPDLDDFNMCQEVKTGLSILAISILLGCILFGILGCI